MSELLLLAALAAAPQAKPGWNQAETDHYVLNLQQTGTDRKATVRDQLYVREMKVKMELLFKQYAAAFKFKGKLPKKAVLRLYKDKPTYVASGAPPTSGAYYRPDTKELVGYQDVKDPDKVFQIICHEGCHQFFDLVFPKFYRNKDTPTWFSEGLADCFGASTFVGRQLYVFRLDGIAKNRVMWIKQFVQQGQHAKLDQLLEMDHREFMAGAQRNYPQSWSFVHFLWNYPGKDGGKGRYKSVVIRLIDGFKEGKSRDEVYADAFQYKGKPMDLDQLEKQWVSFVKTLPQKGF